MSCNNCGSNRIVFINAKCSDLCTAQYNDFESNGYVPEGIGIGGGDYIDFEYCIQCGKIQGEFPIKENELPSELTKEGHEEDEDENNE